MLRPWRNQREFESRLRAHRAEPREEFFDDLVARATPRAVPTRARNHFRRPALVAALTVVLLGAVAALGGVSYASFKAPVTIIKKLAQPASTPHYAISHRNGDESDSHPGTVNRVRNDGHGDDGDRGGHETSHEHETSGHGQYGYKICHRPPGDPGNEHTITVGSTAAVAEHLRHGDHLGHC
jgi:hypothetical protein